MTDVLAVADHRQGSLRDVSFELVTAATKLTEQTGGDLHLLIIGGPVEEFAEKLNLQGVDVIYTVDEGMEFNHDIYVQAVTQVYEAVAAEYVVAPNSVNGLDYVPAVANTLNLPLATDAIGLDANDATLTVTREMYGGKVATTNELDGPAVVTIRGAEWPMAEGPGTASVKTVDFSLDEGSVGSRVTGFRETTGGGVDISEADVLVSIGRGIDEEENLAIIRELAEVLDATISCSRPIVDSGWLPKNRQVGQSGKVVTPDVYLAIGISGAVQHVAGMKGSDAIVAINTDPDAPIMDIADYAIHDDLFDVVPALTEQFQ
ncbi:electron transfer flavoprotein subunit alpha/FixB family protein [Halopenitus sp. POP-27]|uniref:electron transfer flavoprotein subunit alpha/FixB family protein n=1 Tax=Halopenitus sp. POP-27 TaxID=2994425 RepID=UPI0024697BF8|nr:electron transfer flavoprotein subunit alpha/FixB family protein [Halopenitus sp. POP-27]